MLRKIKSPNGNADDKNVLCSIKNVKNTQQYLLPQLQAPLLFNSEIRRTGKDSVVKEGRMWTT